MTAPSTGGQAVSVTRDPFTDWNPVWSAEGSYLYFSSDRGGSMNLRRIAVDELSGNPLGEPEPLTTPALWSGPLSISADGKRIAYCARDRRSNLQRVSFDPARETVTGGVTEVTRGNLFVANPDVSPDGEWIVFNTFFQQSDLYVVRGDGKTSTDSPTMRARMFRRDGRRMASGLFLVRTVRGLRRGRPTRFKSGLSMPTAAGFSSSRTLREPDCLSGHRTGVESLFGRL